MPNALRAHLISSGGNPAGFVVVHAAGTKNNFRRGLIRQVAARDRAGGKRNV